MDLTDRHAYLIMAHGQFDQLIRLIRALDDERNDIFIHVDVKAEGFDPLVFDGTVRSSGLFFTDRVKVYWGSLSIVKAEYILLKKAKEHGKYRYYHLLSGSDYPLKSQSYIHDLLDDSDREYISFFVREQKERMMYYWLFDDDFLKTNLLKSAVRKPFLLLQKLFRVDRTRADDFIIRHGPGWFSITDDLAEYVLGKEAFVMKRWKWTGWPDESFMQTLVYNSAFRERLASGAIGAGQIGEDANEEDANGNSLIGKGAIRKDTDKEDANGNGLIGKHLPLDENGEYDLGCLRLIDWKRGTKTGSPYVWREEDFDRLMASDCLFARKFDPDVDRRIIDRLEENVVPDIGNLPGECGA